VGKFQVSPLDERHDLLVSCLAKALVKISMQYVQDLRYAFCGQRCSCGRRHRDRYCDYAFYVCTILMHTSTLSIEVEYRFGSQKPTPEVGLYKTCAERIFAMGLK